jgi:hypothetical protein
MPRFNQCELMCMIFPFADRTGEETVLREPVYSLCTFFFLYWKVFCWPGCFVVKEKVQKSVASFTTDFSFQLALSKHFSNDIKPCLYCFYYVISMAVYK